MDSSNCRRARRVLAVCRQGAQTLLLVAVWLGFPTAQAQDPASCDSALTRAENDYFAGRFDDAIALLTDCLSRGAFSESEEERAFALLGKVHLANNLESQAREAIGELLTRVPSYQPNPATEPPEFVDFVEEVRQTMPPVEAPEPEPVVTPDVTEPEPVDSMLVMRDPVPADSTETVEEPVVVAPTPPEPSADRTPPKNRSGLTKWLAIGGGALAASVAVLVLTGGDGGGDGEPPGSTGNPLPAPPAFP